MEGKAIDRVHLEDKDIERLCSCGGQTIDCVHMKGKILKDCSCGGQSYLSCLPGGQSY